MKVRPTPAQRLRATVEPMVDGERLLGAFQVGTGPGPGSETFGFLGALLNPLVALGWVGSVAARRQFSTIAVTDDAVWIWSNGRRPNGLATLTKRLDGHGALGHLEGVLEYTIEVDGTSYWLYPIWSDQVRRIERMRRPPTSA